VARISSTQLCRCDTVKYNLRLEVPEAQQILAVLKLAHLFVVAPLCTRSSGALTTCGFPSCVLSPSHVDNHRQYTPLSRCTVSGLPVQVCTAEDYALAGQLHHMAAFMQLWRWLCRVGPHMPCNACVIMHRKVVSQECVHSTHMCTPDFGMVRTFNYQPLFPACTSLYVCL